jgi:general secretion pathway protein D
MAAKLRITPTMSGSRWVTERKKRMIQQLMGFLIVFVWGAHQAQADRLTPMRPGPKKASPNGRPGLQETGLPKVFDAFDVEDEEEEVERAVLRRRQGAPQATIQVGGSSVDGPSPQVQEGAIMVGGSSEVQSEQKLLPLPVDATSGDGSEDVITDFNFPDADILDIAKTLGKLTGKNFILDKDVKGRITIISNSPVTVSEAWKAFLTALDINNFTVVPSGKYLRISRQRDARDKQLRTFAGSRSPDSDALITRLFPLKYINAQEVERTFRSFMPALSRVMAYDQTNTLIVTDTGSNILKLAKMLELLDIEGFDAGIEVIQVKFASAAELSKLIDTLIPGTQSSGTGGGMPRFGMPGMAAARFAARRTKEGGIINTIIADDRTNNLIVHANSRGANQVRELVAKLDQKLPVSVSGGRIRVIFLQFADAEQLANTLNSISQGASMGGGGGGGRPAAGGGTGSNPLSNSLFEGSIKIAADKATNSLVVTASPSDFTTIKRVVRQLDVPRDQVYVEVIVMEVSVERNFDFAANLASPILGLASITNSAAAPALAGGIAKMLTTEGFRVPLIWGQGPGFGSNGFPNSAGAFSEAGLAQSRIAGLMNIFQKHTNTNILATPQIIAMDNTEAKFESSRQEPIRQVSIIPGNTTGAMNSSYTYRPVMLSVEIKPQINKLTNIVRMDINTKYESILSRVAEDSSIPPTIQTRAAKTQVVVSDSDTIILGGLIEEKNEESTRKVPILGDIPILGWLFKSRHTEVKKGNLLVFLTPHIIRPYEKFREILNHKIKERDEFLEEEADGVDLGRKARDAILKDLPNIDQLREATRNAFNPGATVEDEPKDEEREPASLTHRQKGSQGVHNAQPQVAAPAEPPVEATTPEASEADQEAQMQSETGGG